MSFRNCDAMRPKESTRFAEGRELSEKDELLTPRRIDRDVVDSASDVSCTFESCGYNLRLDTKPLTQESQLTVATARPTLGFDASRSWLVFGRMVATR